MSFQQPPGPNEPPPYNGGAYPPPPPAYGAQPSYGPSYGPPPQGPPTPGQWPYGPPGYGPPQPPPRRGPGTGVIVAAVAGTLAVITVVVLAATGVLFSDDKDSKADPTASVTATTSGRTTPAPTSTAAAPPAPPSRPATTTPPVKRTVDTPARAGGFDRLTESEYPQITQMRQQAVPGSKVAAYGKTGDPAPTALVMLLANPGGQPPATVLEQMMIGMREGAQKKSAPDLGIDRELDAGSLGGLMRCISIMSGDKVLPTCVWADRDTVGVVYAINETTLEGAATLARKVRPDLER